ncbi:MAG: hypothetical protein IT327_15055 [Anaerolineae bacterium]|nr:hypothetical protein [Anaerolineae bacterium]
MEKQIYQICVQGHLDARWLHRFEGLTLSLTPSGQTILTGPVVDQAALYGLLNQLRDLGLDLISLQRQPQDTQQENQHVNK